MAEYTVTRDYGCVFDSREGRRQVALSAGSTVDVSDELAEFIERDSPGTLEKPKPKRGRRSSKSEDDG